MKKKVGGAPFFPGVRKEGRICVLGGCFLGFLFVLVVDVFVEVFLAEAFGDVSGGVDVSG